MAAIEANLLVESAMAGDQKAFGELVRQHAGLVTGVAYSVCGDFSRSEDVGQEAFLEAWKNLSTLREPAKFSSWLCTITRRRAIDLVRRLKSKSTDSLDVELEDRSNANPEAMMEADQERTMVWSMLEQLPETYRETMVLFYRSEQSVAEVATALAENEATIRQRLKRGRELMKRDLADSISRTLTSTVPKAAFAAAVMAAIPSTTYAAGTVGAAAATGKAGIGVGGAATTALGAAIFGSLTGIAGGLFGAWNSWRTAEYKSQQQFIVRTSIHYCIGFTTFMVLLGILLWFRVNGDLSDGAYLFFFLGLMLTGFLFSGFWMWSGFRTYKRIENEAIKSGEPRCQEMAGKLDAFREQAKTIREDGSVGYEAFQWNAGGWWGALLGGTAWMVPTAGVFLAKGDTVAAGVVAACFATAVICGVTIWQKRETLRALFGFQLILGILGVLTFFVLASFQFLASAKAQAILQWTPWAWLLLLMFPAMMIHFYNIQRQTEKRMLEQDQMKSKSEPKLG